MQSKLPAYERRTRILEYLVLKKQSTRCELSKKFGVSLCTISRDILMLENIAPIYTKQGNQGGVYILSEYRSYKNYLTKIEEDCLRGLMNKADEDERHILNAIIIKFSMDGS